MCRRNKVLPILSYDSAFTDNTANIMTRSSGISLSISDIYFYMAWSSSFICKLYSYHQNQEIWSKCSLEFIVVIDTSCYLSHYSVAVKTSMNTPTDLKQILSHGQYTDMLATLWFHGFIKYQIERDLKDHLVQPFLARAWSRQGVSTPCPAKS